MVLGLFPLFLLESRLALLAVVAVRVVLTVADELEGIVGINDITVLGVAVAHAAPTNTDILDRVEILQRIHVNRQSGHG